MLLYRLHRAKCFTNQSLSYFLPVSLQLPSCGHESAARGVADARSYRVGAAGDLICDPFKLTGDLLSVGRHPVPTRVQGHCPLQNLIRLRRFAGL